MEELAKKLSLNLSKKLEKGEIAIEEMARVIDRFLKLAGQAENTEELEDFIKKYD